MQVYFRELLKGHSLFGLFPVQYLLKEVTNQTSTQTEMNRTPAPNVSSRSSPLCCNLEGFKNDVLSIGVAIDQRTCPRSWGRSISGAHPGAIRGDLPQRRAVSCFLQVANNE